MRCTATACLVKNDHKVFGNSSVPFYNRLMNDQARHNNAYVIQSVDIISAEEQVAFIMTEAGGYVVASIPETGTDAREADILFVASSLPEAIEKYESVYG